MAQRGNSAPTVLLVDDEADVRLLWRMVFEVHGGFGAIFEAADGARALELLRTESFEVVVTDFSMPGVSGLEVIDATLSGSPSTVVVMVSATADVGQEALRRGASAFFDKWESTTDLLPRFVTAVLAELEALGDGSHPGWSARPAKHGRALVTR
ncbi:MAG: response regulator transcription factor [Acidimicrobiia bacterium]